MAISILLAGNLAKQPGLLPGSLADTDAGQGTDFSALLAEQIQQPPEALTGRFSDQQATRDTSRHAASARIRALSIGEALSPRQRTTAPELSPSLSSLVFEHTPPIATQFVIKTEVTSTHQKSAAAQTFPATLETENLATRAEQESTQDTRTDTPAASVMPDPISVTMMAPQTLTEEASRNPQLNAAAGTSAITISSQQRQGASTLAGSYPSDGHNQEPPLLAMMAPQTLKEEASRNPQLNAAAGTSAITISSQQRQGASTLAGSYPSDGHNQEPPLPLLEEVSAVQKASTTTVHTAPTTPSLPITELLRQQGTPYAQSSLPDALTDSSSALTNDKSPRNLFANSSNVNLAEPTTARLTERDVDLNSRIEFIRASTQQEPPRAGMETAPAILAGQFVSKDELNGEQPTTTRQANAASSATPPAPSLSPPALSAFSNGQPASMHAEQAAPGPQGAPRSSLNPLSRQAAASAQPSTSAPTPDALLDVSVMVTALPDKVPSKGTVSHTEAHAAMNLSRHFSSTQPSTADNTGAAKILAALSGDNNSNPAPRPVASRELPFVSLPGSKSQLGSTPGSINDAGRFSGLSLTAGSDTAKAPVTDQQTVQFQSTLQGISAQTERANTASATTADRLAPIQTPLHDPRWSQHLGDRIAWMARGEIQTAQLNITPAQLGPIQINISLQGDQLTAQFVSANQEVRQVLEESLHRLREMLSGSGINLGQANVGTQQQQRESPSQFPGAVPFTREDAILSDDAAWNSLPTQPLQHGRGLVDLFA